MEYLPQESKKDGRTKMKIFTFTSKQGNYTDGEYDFMANQWTEALKMAINFEKIHNKGASNENYKVKFDINRSSVRVVTVKPGFINIRGRKYHFKESCLKSEKIIKLLE
jgi:hypothetical protein